MLLLFGSDLRLNYNFSRGALPSGTTFTRASAGTYFDADGVLQSATNNVPRFDYDPVTLQPRGLLMEDQRRNRFQYSSDFTNAVWDSGGATVTPNQAVSPAGDMTAARIRLVTGFIFQTLPGVVAKHTLSVFAKAVSGTSKFRLEYFVDGVNYRSADFTATSSWQRFQFTIDTTASWAQFAIINSSDESDVDIYAWGAQLEQGAGATSYIPTTSTEVTRAADQLSFTIPTGVNYLIYVFDDNSTQKVSVSAGAYTVPTTLNRTHIKSIYGV